MNFSRPYGEAAFLHAPAQIDVLYEDENLLLVNKPSGLIVHEDEKEAFDTPDQSNSALPV